MLDLRGPRGLSTALRSELPIADAVAENLHCSLMENLDVLASGPRPANPAELLCGDRFQELLAWAETSYDQILVDSPPAIFTDTAIVGRQVDGVLLVVQPEKNPRRLVTRVTENFATMSITVLGIVANRLSAKKSEGYYGYGYGYGPDEDAVEDAAEDAAEDACGVALHDMDATERFRRPMPRNTQDAA